MSKRPQKVINDNRKRTLYLSFNKNNELTAYKLLFPNNLQSTKKL